MAKEHSDGQQKKNKRASRHRQGYSREGLSEYRIWAGIKSRCLNPNRKSYPSYGGRGIKVCSRWRQDFLAFLDDMGARPSPSYSIDRIDNDKGYTCGKCEECRANGWEFNCRWATKAEQDANRRNNVHWAFQGRTLTIAEWARERKVNPMVLRIRVFRLGWTIEEALTIPRRQAHPASTQLKIQARNAVNHEIAAGRLPPPRDLTCVCCGRPARHYHHRNGYNREQWLDVEPRCLSCNLRATP